MKSSKTKKKELTLKECLKKLPQEEIEKIYKEMPEELKVENNKYSNIEQFIQMSFVTAIAMIQTEEMQIITDIIEEKDVDEVNEALLKLHFVFKVDDKYIVPKEIKELYNSVSLEEIKEEQKQAAYEFYILINGVLDIDTLMNLVNSSSLNTTKEEMMKYLKQKEYMIKDNLVYLNELAYELDKKWNIYKQNKNKEYQTYNIIEIIMYLEELQEDEKINDLKNILGKKTDKDDIKNNVIEIIMAGYNFTEMLTTYL